MQYEYIGTIPPTGYSPPGSVGLDTTGPTLYITGKDGVWTQVGGSSVTFPISLLEGGTGVAASTQQQARTGLGAAASGNNSDIHSLTGISGLSITADEILLNNGTQQAELTPTTLSIGTILPNASGILQIGPTPPASPTQIQILGLESDTLILSGPTPPACTTGQIGFSAATASTATAGGGQAVPGTVLVYVIVNIAGVLGKMPVFAV